MESRQNDLIFETPYWSVLLNDDQAYLGRSVVLLKCPCGDLAEITAEELIDFLEVVKKLEAAFKKAFDATMFNWSCLMNNAYQNNPPDPQVHWHVRPRYSHDVEFGGEVFKDEEFGKHYARGNERAMAQELRAELIKKIRSCL